MKKLFVIALLAAACWSLTSCHKDNSGTEETGTETLSEENIFWGVVGQLIDYRDMTVEYKGKTFTPAIGSPQNGDESIRVVAVNDPGAAAARFNDLVGASIDENTASYTWQHKAVGSLTWNKTTDNTSWATVDVNIPSVPGLHKIIYRSPEQGDANGSVGDGGSAYYRFGDVIQKTREDGKVEYWICVRPSFDPEGKGDCHFVTVSPLPMDNVWPYNSTDVKQKGKPHMASNDMYYGLPTKIRNEVKWHQDLAELLFAIMYPDIWATNVSNYYTENKLGYPNGLRMFEDFHGRNIKYHNADFWKNVQREWKSRALVRQIFGISYEEMEAALNPNMANARGLHLLYDGYSWNTVTSNKPKLFQVHYSHGSKNEEKNLHKQTKSTISSQVVVPNNKTESNTNYSLDVYTRLTEEKPYLVEQRFFSDENPRWIVRYATGEELATNKKFDAQQPISGFTTANEVYRYYRDVLPEKNLTDAPEVTEKHVSIQNDRSKQNLTTFDGEGHYGFGDVLKDGAGNRWIVVRPSGGNTEQNEYTEKSPYAELVSFEGITYSADKQTATNIVNRDRAIRLAFPLWFLFQEYYKKTQQYATGAAIMPVAKNIKDEGGVNLMHLMQEVAHERYQEPNQMGGAELCSIAYYEAGSSKQHLLRYITECGLNNVFITVIYDKYPNVSTQENIYPGIKLSQFSDTPIYLQDVADATKVSAYGNDYMAKAPTQDKKTVPRPYRTSVETKANDVTNYFYNQATWEAGTQPFGMWNEPVLFFRGTALYDRGNEYATRTVDGLELEMVSKCNFNTEYYNPYSWFHPAFTYQQAEDRFVNGLNTAIYSWQGIWGQ